MQLLSTEDFYFIKSVRTILKCCRVTGDISVYSHSDLAALEDFELLGDIFAFIGKITLEDVVYLLLATECTEVARIGVKNAGTIWRIDRTIGLPLNTNKFMPILPIEGLRNQPKKLAKLISNKVQQNRDGLPSPPSTKIIYEIVAFFNQPSSFYFAHGLDITRNLQSEALSSGGPDRRFFWNRDMLKEFFVRDGSPIPAFHEWICPIIYGHVDQRSLTFDVDALATLTLISRRSVKRAGVRYLRRGIDEEGNVANFVESEYIISLFGHSLSFVQCRGSVPIFWSQKGIQLRPPLSIDRSLAQSLPTFGLHIRQMLANYSSPVVLVNLVDQAGKEASLGQHFLEHVLAMDCPEVAYHAFDFHRVCGTRRHDKLQHELMDNLREHLTRIGFCWKDRDGQIVLRQKGVIRTNCVDCLDRTNVVQSAISQAVCLIQCRKLGIVEPVTEAPEPLVKLMQRMWADHGDIISKQYAGTSALKGDITREGQRKLTGLVKDGYNSASRYYLSQLRDTNRQSSSETTNGAGADED